MAFFLWPLGARRMLRVCQRSHWVYRYSKRLYRSVAIIGAIDITLIVAATIAIVVVMIEIVWIYNLGF